MLYIRGNSRDYDAWARDYGAYGWSWKEVLPYFIKSEDNRDPEIAYNGRHRSLVLICIIVGQTCNETKC